MIFLCYKTHNSVGRYYWLARRKYQCSSIWILFRIDKLILPDYTNSFLPIQLFDSKNILNLVSEYILPLSLICLFASSHKKWWLPSKIFHAICDKKTSLKIVWWFIHRLKRHGEICEYKSKHLCCDTYKTAWWPYGVKYFGFYVKYFTHSDLRCIANYLPCYVEIYAIT